MNRAVDSYLWAFPAMLSDFFGFLLVSLWYFSVPGATIAQWCSLGSCVPNFVILNESDRVCYLVWTLYVLDSSRPIQTHFFNVPQCLSSEISDRCLGLLSLGVRLLVEDSTLNS